MKAIVQDAYGDAPENVLRLAEVARPTCGDDEILVHVRAASVDRGTWHIMAGLPYLIRFVGFGLRRPKAPNPGRSLAGTVESVGKNVTEFKPGDDVYGSCDGSFAEYALARAELLARKPANLSYEQAAAVPVSGVAALQAVRDRAHVQVGQKVLIIGAAGGVGTFAVQIAKAYGAEVTGVCSTTQVDLVRSIGADHVIDYTAKTSPTASTTTTRSSTPEATARSHNSVARSRDPEHSSSSAAKPVVGGSAGSIARSGPSCSPCSCRRSSARSPRPRTPKT